MDLTPKSSKSARNSPRYSHFTLRTGMSYGVRYLWYRVSNMRFSWKWVSKIVKNHKNDSEMPYKYISDHLRPLGSGLEAFIYDFEKMIFWPTGSSSPPDGYISPKTESKHGFRGVRWAQNGSISANSWPIWTKPASNTIRIAQENKLKHLEWKLGIYFRS